MNTKLIAILALALSITALTIAIIPYMPTSKEKLKVEFVTRTLTNLPNSAYLIQTDICIKNPTNETRTFYPYLPTVGDMFKIRGTQTLEAFQVIHLETKTLRNETTITINIYDYVDGWINGTYAISNIR